MAAEMRSLAQCVLALCMTFGIAWADPAGNPLVVRKTKDCGSFTVSSTTLLANSEDDLSPVIAQSIRLVNLDKQVDTRLDLVQHRSSDPDLKGASTLDAAVFTWSCPRAASGRRFLFLYLACTNEGAHTCSTAMDSRRHEWELIFDDRGRSLLPTPNIVSHAQLRTLKTLGVWQMMMRDAESKDQEMILR